MAAIKGFVMGFSSSMSLPLGIIVKVRGVLFDFAGIENKDISFA